MKTARKTRVRAFVSLVVLSIAFPLLHAQLSTETEKSQRPAVEKISPVLLDAIQTQTLPPSIGPVPDDGMLPVIVRVREQFFRRDELERARTGMSRKHMLSSAHAYTARLAPHQIAALLDSNLVEYVTIDMPLRAAGKKNKGNDLPTEDTKPPDQVPPNDNIRTIGADRVSQTGSGVGIAVFDSGIEVTSDLSSGQIAETVDFTSGEAVVVDPDKREGFDEYGHGTHVAGILMSDGKKSLGEYIGVARRAHVVDLKVIGADGIGKTSNLIKAIDWAIENKRQYNIRVANLSLGHPAVESYLEDPLCEAVRQLVSNGIVTVVSAGNLGKTENHPYVVGGITSPGIEPTVITVGPVNTRGTATHSDDIATSYGSRGPSFDGLFKPDLVAPGNAISSLLATDTWIHENHPDSVVDETDTVKKDRYIELSGASMATAFVSGTAALMIHEVEKLTPAAVKMMLMLSAVKLTNLAMIEQGNGLLNVKTAVEMAEVTNPKKGKVNSDGVSPFWMLDGEEVWAGGAVAFGNQILYSPLVDSTDLPTWGDAVLWADHLDPSAVLWADGVFDHDELWSDAVLWADATAWTDSDVFVNAVLWADAILWADTIHARDFNWANAILWADYSPSTTALLSGDK